MPTRSHVKCPKCYGRMLRVGSGFICDNCNSNIYPSFVRINMSPRKIKVAVPFGKGKDNAATIAYYQNFVKALPDGSEIAFIIKGRANLELFTQAVSNKYPSKNSRPDPEHVWLRHIPAKGFCEASYPIGTGRRGAFRATVIKNDLTTEAPHRQKKEKGRAEYIEQKKETENNTLAKK